MKTVSWVHLCDDLLEQGHEVIGLDNFFRGKEQNLPKHENFSFYECDLRDSSTGWGVKLHIYNTQPDVIVHYECKRNIGIFTTYRLKCVMTIF